MCERGIKEGMCDGGGGVCLCKGGSCFLFEVFITDIHKGTVAGGYVHKLQGTSVWVYEGMRALY